MSSTNRIRTATLFRLPGETPTTSLVRAIENEPQFPTPPIAREFPAVSGAAVAALDRAARVRGTTADRLTLALWNCHPEEATPAAVAWLVGTLVILPLLDVRPRGRCQYGRPS